MIYVNILKEVRNLSQLQPLCITKYILRLLNNSLLLSKIIRLGSNNYTDTLWIKQLISLAYTKLKRSKQRAFELKIIP